jgi:GNAT superfamily N-acetyltransferase
MKIVPASPDLWPAIAALFSAGGDPKWCWCQWWRRPGSSWSSASADDHRRGLETLVRAEPAPGLVALRDGVAIGWVGLGPREGFPRLTRSRVLPQLPGDDVWSINCFVVARRARRQGVADALLGAAVAYARDHGARLVEGIPVDTGGERMPSAGAYTGTRRMFERHGFTLAAPTASKGSGGRPRVLMRRQL